MVPWEEFEKIPPIYPGSPSPYRLVFAAVESVLLVYLPLLEALYHSILIFPYPLLAVSLGGRLTYSVGRRVPSRPRSIKVACNP